MDLNDRLGACGMSKLPITNSMIAKQGQQVKALLLEKDAKKPFLTAQERKTMNVSRRFRGSSRIAIAHSKYAVA
jgi:hypothetical protein